MLRIKQHFAFVERVVPLFTCKCCNSTTWAECIDALSEARQRLGSRQYQRRPTARKDFPGRIRILCTDFD